MKTREEADLENLALAAELARQLCHEFSNFLYTLFLQIEIAQASSPGGTGGASWESIKKEGKQIARLMDEWDRFHDRFSWADGPVDLHTLVGAIAKEAASDRCPIELAPGLRAETLPIVSSVLDCKHLLRLLVEDLRQTWEDAVGGTPIVRLETARENDKVILRFTANGDEKGQFEKMAAIVESTSLHAQACRSLAVRLGARIERERTPGGCCIRVEFPTS